MEFFSRHRDAVFKVRSPHRTTSIKSPAGDEFRLARESISQKLTTSSLQNEENTCFIKHLSPYIQFNGTAAKAIGLYQSALGAKTERLVRYADVPDMKRTPEAKDQVMHAQLRIGEATVMVGDAAHGRPAAAEGNTQVATDAYGARWIFNCQTREEANGQQ
jgi:uncharacterized glyoxalase superfamily protein PhnB